MALDLVRKLLPGGATVSDDELAEIRELLYAVAETVVDEVIESRKTPPERATRTGAVEEEGSAEA